MRSAGTISGVRVLWGFAYRGGAGARLPRCPGNFFGGGPCACFGGGRTCAGGCYPGAEPVAFGGYAAALLLDADSMLRFDSLRAPEAALRRWFNAAALVRSAAQGGVVVTTASPSPVEQALVRWDPTWFALYELDERSQIGLPPAVRTAAITGTEDDVQAFLAELNLPENVRVTGPVPLDEDYFAHQSAGVESGERGMLPSLLLLTPMRMRCPAIGVPFSSSPMFRHRRLPTNYAPCVRHSRHSSVSERCRSVVMGWMLSNN